MDRDIARHLVEERARLGLTQGEFAARIGVSQGAVSRWEKGRHRPNPEVLLRLGRLSGGAGLLSEKRGPAPKTAPPYERMGGRSRLRFRPLEVPRRRLSDLLEDSIDCALRAGKVELAEQLMPILDRCLEAERSYKSGRRASDQPSN